MYNDPAFIIFGNTVIYWYGLFIAAALGIGVIAADRLRRQQNDGDGSDMLIASTAALAAAFLGSRFYYCWCFPGEYDFSSFWKISSGGFSVPGALLGEFIGLAVYCLAARKKLGEILDCAAPATAFAVAFGRMAAMFSGEDLGGVVTSKFLQFFPVAVYCRNEKIFRYSFFSMDAFIVLAIGLFLLWLFRQKYSLKSITFKTGDLYLLFVILYFITQGMFEQYRIDPLYFANVPLALRKLQTTPVSFSLGALFAAAALAVFILRSIISDGIHLRNVWPIAACGMFYFGYFNKFLRVDSESEALNTVLLVLSAFALVGIGIMLFFKNSLKFIRRPAPARPQPQPRPRPVPRPNPSRQRFSSFGPF